SVAFTTLKIAVLAPIPSARVSNTVAVMRGDFHMVLKAKRTSCHRFMGPLSGNYPLFRLAVLPACCQVALDAKDRYRIGGGQITPRRSYLDQGGTTPLMRAYAIDCPRCSC